MSPRSPSDPPPGPSAAGAPRRAFQARYPEFEAMREHVAASCQGVPQEEQERVVLVLEELFCNTVEHGYQGESDQPVWVTIAAQGGGCRITYEDSAKAHDPFQEAGDPLLDASVEDRPVGGLGLFLLKELASGHAYARVDGRNVITVELAWKGAP